MFVSKSHCSFQINCKLFAFDKTNMNWQERGRGTLRLNDREHNGTLHSRLGNSPSFSLFNNFIVFKIVFIIVFF